MRSPSGLLRYCTVTLFSLVGALPTVSEEPALARLSFWVPPERMTQFEAAYREELSPLLERHGLKESPREGRATVDSVFSRLFEVKAPADVPRLREVLGEDPAWTAELQDLSRTLGAGRTQQPDGGVRYAFGLYTTPAGPGETVSAAPGVGQWHSYDLSEGLPEGYVRSIVQDREGSLWFGTRSGVSRYDGQTWTTFGKGDGLASNSISSILRDREGHLWFGTDDSGVSRYDGEIWTTFSKDDGLASNSISSILQDREGHWWFGTDGGGVSRYDGRVWTTYSTEDGLAHGSVHAVLEDRGGHLWFGTRNGVSRYDGHTWTTLTTEDGLASNFVLSILEDRDGVLWFGTNDRGVSRYDGHTWTTLTKEDGLASNHIWSILEDQDGHLWFGTDYGGVSRYDGRRFSTFTTEDGLIHNAVFSIFQDREGYLWFGNRGGVNRYDGLVLSTFTSKEGLGYREMAVTYQDRDGHIWFGTYGGGVSRYDGQTFTTFTTKDGLASNYIWSILEDQDGHLWFGTDFGGVSRYDGRTFTTFAEEDGVGLQPVAIIQDQEGHIWAGTMGGVSRYDSSTGTGPAWTTFTTADGLPESRFLQDAILEDRDGGIWTCGRGVSRYDGQKWTTFTTEDGLANEWVNTVFQDRDGDLWFGTIYNSVGVSRFDGERFTTLSTEDGLATNGVYGMLQDRNGHLWFGGRGGVSRYDGTVFQVMTTRDGLANSYVRSLLEDREGSIWISTVGGVTRFRPPSPTPPPVSIDAVVADERYEGASELSLPSDAGVVSFEFHATSFKTRPEAMVYQYRLEGRDEEWRTTHARRVEYASLPRGEYTFQVQAVDRDLVYSETPATVSLRVRWPHERSAWIGALSVAALLIAGQTARVLRRDRRLHQANVALSSANEEIQAVNQRILEETQNKSEFLSRMSHDLRTPMNAIIGYTRILLRRSKDALEDRQYRNLENIQTSASNLLNLINEILDLSRIEAGRIELKPEPVDLGQLVGECVTSVAPLAKPGVELVQELGDVPAIKTDADRIRRVVMNLLGNAEVGVMGR